MLNPAEFRELVSGRRTGILATAMRGLLRVAEAPYSLAVNWRNWRYDLGRATMHCAGVPVVSVGNLSLGGTGKTPMVKWIARWFSDRGLRVVIVSRGYGARPAAGNSEVSLNDEALELQQSLPNVPHVQNPDRVAAATRAIDEFDAQVVLLDDGFQHRRLGRNLDIVLLDALEPFGFDHVFPRGTLREQVAGLRRAQVICLSRADTISQTERENIRRRVAEVAPQAAWCELVHAANSLTNAAGQTRPLAEIAGQRVAAFCGIGNPAGFQHTLAATGCDVVAWRAFPDHHAYTAADRSALEKVIADSRVEIALCTQKDLVKLQSKDLGSVPLWAVAIEMEFLCGRESLDQALATCVGHALPDASIK